MSNGLFVNERDSLIFLFQTSRSFDGNALWPSCCCFYCRK